MDPRRFLCSHGSVRIGLYVSTVGVGDLGEILARFERAEQHGFHTAWVGQVFEHDALTLHALAGRVTKRIELGSWVVPTPPRHPSVLAQQALTVQAACGGRLLLGIGVSHETIIEGRLGLSLARPLRHMREYLAVLRPLLAGEVALHRGEEFRVSLQLDPLGTAPPPLLLGALGPRMLSLAGARADGAAIWLGGPRYLEEFAIPRLREAAREAARPAPRIACGLPVAVCANTARARASTEAMLARSARLPASIRMTLPVTTTCPE